MHLDKGGYALVNTNAVLTLNLHFQLEVYTSTGSGYYIFWGGGAIPLNTITDPNTQKASGKVEVVVDFSVPPLGYVAVWYNSDVESGPTQQPVGAEVDWYIRQLQSDNTGISDSVNTGPFQTISTRDTVDDTDITSAKPNFLVGSFDLRSYVPNNNGGYSYFLQLYHQLLNNNNFAYGTAYNWTITPTDNTYTSFSFYQANTPNGSGYLYLPQSGPSWDGGAPHPIGVRAYGSGFVIVAESGLYLAFDQGIPWDGSAYGGAQQSRYATYTSDITQALVWSQN